MKQAMIRSRSARRISMGLLILQLSLAAHYPSRHPGTRISSAPDDTTLAPRLIVSTPILPALLNESPRPNSADTQQVREFMRRPYARHYSPAQLKETITRHEFLRKQLLGNESARHIWEAFENPEHQHHSFISNMLDMFVAQYVFIMEDYLKWPENQGVVIPWLFMGSGITHDIFIRIKSLLEEERYVDAHNRVGNDFEKLRDDFTQKLSVFWRAQGREETDTYLNAVTQETEKLLLIAKRHGPEAIRKELEIDMLPSLFTSLNNIAGNTWIQPRKVHLQKSYIGAAARIDKEYAAAKQTATGQKPLVCYWPLKGDPWQLGHLGALLKMFEAGADKVYVFHDDSDPRKPLLSPSIFREVMSQQLFAAMEGYAERVYFQSENKELRAADGEISSATLVALNEEALPYFAVAYVAGYDHFKFAVMKNGLQRDVVAKLTDVIVTLIAAGVDAELGAIFIYRPGESDDTGETALKKQAAFSRLTEVIIRQYMLTELRRLAAEPSVSAPGTRRYIEQILKAFDEDTQRMLDDPRAEYPAAWIQQWYGEHQTLHTQPLPENRLWQQRLVDSLQKAFEKIGASENGPRRSLVARQLLPDLMAIANEAQERGAAIQKGLEVLRNFAREKRIPHQVLLQTIAASATRIRVSAELHLMTTLDAMLVANAAGPGSFIGLLGSNKIDKDKKIAAHILGTHVIDLNLLKGLTGAGWAGILAADNEELRAHLGPIAKLVDMDILVAHLNARRDDAQQQPGLVTLYFSDRAQYIQRLQHLQATLEKEEAGGTALHVIDAYLSAYLMDENMQQSLAPVMDAKYSEVPDVGITIAINRYIRYEALALRVWQLYSARKAKGRHGFVPDSFLAIRKKQLDHATQIRIQQAI